MEKLKAGFENMFADWIPFLQWGGFSVCVVIAIVQFVKSRSDDVVETQTGKKHVMKAIVSIIIGAMIWVVPAVAESIAEYWK